MSEELLDTEDLRPDKQEVKRRFGICMVLFLLSFLAMDVINIIVYKVPSLLEYKTFTIAIFVFSITLTWSIYVPKMLNRYYPDSDILVIPFAAAFTATILVFLYKIFQALAFSEIPFNSIDASQIINAAFLLGIITFLIANVVIRKVRKRPIAWAVTLIIALWIIGTIIYT